jgi:predicted transcriptional regulator
MLRLPFLPSPFRWQLSLTRRSYISKLTPMEVHLKPETESRLDELASRSGLPTDDLMEAAMAGYLQEVAEVRHTLDSRYDDIKSGRVKSVGPNATLVADDFETVIRRLKAELAGEIQVGGPVLAQSLTEAGLIDEYRLYLRPVVLGGGQPFFAGPRPPLRLVASDLIADDLIRLTYVPA